MRIRIAFVAWLCTQMVWAQPELPVMILKTKSINTESELQSRHGSELAAAGVIEAEAYFWKAEGHELGSLDRIFRMKVRDLGKSLAAARQWDWVEYAEPEFAHELLFIPNDSLPGFTRSQLRALHWGHTNSKVYQAWDHSQGDTSVVIGIIDTGGFTQHPSLKDQWAYNYKELKGKPGVDDDLNGIVDDTLGYDFANWDNNVAHVNEHGTQVAGVAGARVNDNFGSFGVGFKCRLMPLKVQHSTTQQLRNIYRAVLYAAQNGCKIINLSLGRVGLPARFEQEVIDWVTHQYGVLVVAAAGNSGKLDNYFPASYRNVLSVVHIGQDDQRELQFGSTTRSYFIDLTAPGVNLFSTTANLSVNQGHRGNISGSSFAAPFTAGVAGLIWSKYPKLYPQQVAELIRATTDNTYSLPANSPYPEQLGTGRLNALKAVTYRDSVNAFRLLSYRAETQKGTLLMPGDTAKISATFVNYLNRLSSPFSAKCTAVSPYAKILDSVISVSLPLGEMDTFSLSSPLRLAISANCPAGHQILLRFQYTYSNRTDYEYHILTVNPLNFLNDGAVALNSWAVLGRDNGHLSQSGTFAYHSTSNQKIEMLRNGGLVLAAAGRTAVAFDTISDFTEELSSDLNEFFDTLISIQSKFTDRFQKNPLGISITQNIVAYTHTGNREYLILEYDLHNQSKNTYDTLFCGVLGQWAFSDSLTAVYSTSHQTLVVFDSLHPSVKAATFKVLNPQAQYYAFDLDSVASPGIRLSDGLSRSEILEFVRGGRHTAGRPNGGKRVATYSGTQLLYFAPGQRRQLRILAIGQSGSSPTIAQSLAAGLSLTKQRNTISPKPVVEDTLFCGFDSAVVAPKGGDLFDIGGVIAPSRKISAADTAQTFFIRNLTKTFPSDTVTVRLHDKGFEVNFAAGEICQGGVFVPTATTKGSRYTGEVALRFGHADSTAERFIFDEAGKYPITLTATSQNGCTRILTDTLMVWGQVGVTLKAGEICVGDTARPVYQLITEPLTGKVEIYYTIGDSVLAQLVFPAAGKYPLTIHAISEHGCEASYTDTLVVLALPDTSISQSGAILTAAPAAAYQWYWDGKPAGNERTQICRWPGFYWVELTSEKGCKATSAKIDMRAQGLETYADNLMVFPNPAVHSVTIQLIDEQELIERLEVVDLAGHVLMTSAQLSGSGLTLQVSGLTSGVYFVHIQTNLRHLQVRLVKQ